MRNSYLYNHFCYMYTGGPSWNWTSDTKIFSLVLCQLSYRTIILVARPRFELGSAWVKVMCLTAWLPGNNGGADGSRTRVQKIFTNHKSHSYLTGFVYIVLSILFTIYKSQKQVLILRSFTTANLLEKFICAAIFAKLIRLCFSLIALILHIKVAWLELREYYSIERE